TNVYVLANFSNQGLTIRFHGRNQWSCVSHVLSEGFVDAAADEVFEIVLQSQEVSLGVDFDDQRALVIVSQFDCDSTFSSDVTGFLGSLDGTSSTHIVDCFFDVATSCSQGFFTVHHALASTLTQFFN